MQNKFVIIPGFRKCGTTTLYDWLYASGKFVSFSKKETQILGMPYSEVSNVIDNLNKDFRKKPLLDGSTFYSHSTHFLDNLKMIKGDVKMILVIRDPVSRFISSIGHMMAKGPDYEPRNWQEIVSFYSEQKGCDNIIANEYRLCQFNEQKGLSVPVPDDYFVGLEELKSSSHSYDRYLGWRYFYESLYSQFIPDDLLKKDNTLLISFENLINDTDKTKQKIEEFLNLEIHGSLPHANITVKTTFMISYLRKIKSLSPILSSRFPVFIESKIRSILGSKIEKPEQFQIDMLKDLFADESNVWKKYDNDLTKYWL